MVSVNAQLHMKYLNATPAGRHGAAGGSEMQNQDQEKAPHGAGPGGGEAGRPMSLSDGMISKLKVGDGEAIRLVALGLAAECHEFALSREIASESVEHHLPFVFGIFEGNLCDLIRVVPVATCCATDIGAVRIEFCPEGYRRLAEAAKDRMADAIDGNGGLI